ncbi:hypothetical protein E4U23_001616 [Claviceps purpurea]|nr:hypothetical protein E4U23_001616 [Claviceps purpurea]
MIVGAIETYQELKLSFFTSHNHGTTLEKVPADHGIAITWRRPHALTALTFAVAGGGYHHRRRRCAGGPITIDDGTELDCNQQQKEANLEDIEKMKVEEDDSDSEDEGSLGQPALPQEQTFASLGALESYLHDFTRSKWYGRKKEASGKMSRLYFAAVVVVSKIASARQVHGATRSRPSASGKWLQ